MIKELENNFGQLFDKELISEINQVGTFKNIPKGFMLMDIGEPISHIPLLISGAIKILRDDESGRELLLYYIEKGETCSVTLNCCLGNKKSEIRAISETDTKLIMIPIIKMNEWLVKYQSWRNYVLNSYQNRLNELLTTINKIAFDALDERLLKYLFEKSRITNSKIIEITHQEIAFELNSSRVVISRLLKKLEQLNKIKIHRNLIEIKDL
jgi:CRP/FNR family transcriptional regulator, anaerobic regulatory protein